MAEHPRPGSPTVAVRAFTPEEWRLYRDLRLRALLDSPDAFGSTYAREILYTDAEWTERLARAASSPRDLPLVAEWEGEPCGLAWGRLDESQPAAAHLYQMWVAPERRRQGIARALLDAAAAWAQAAGARTLVLDVTSDNGPARRVYARAGFVPTGELKPLRPGAALQSETMRRSLLPDAREPSA